MSKQTKCDVCGGLIPNSDNGVFEFGASIKLPKPIESNTGTQTHDDYSFMVGKVCSVDNDGYGSYADSIDICESCLTKLLKGAYSL